MSRLFDEADRIFIAERSMSEALNRPGARYRIGPHDLFRFLTEDDSDLVARVTPALFRIPRLREELASLRNRIAAVHIPALAAASSDLALTERPFPGGVIRIVSSQTDQTMYLIIILEGVVPTGPHTLLVEGQNGSMVRRSLSPFDSSGEVMLVLAGDNDDRNFIEMLGDPQSSASLLPMTEGI